jgi:RNA polymerase sigma factor (TIGR02999 family)
MCGVMAEDTTALLLLAAQGDSHAVDRLMPVLYDDLHRVAHRMLSRESPGRTLQTTALLNEAYLRLVDQKRVDWRSRTHFLAIGAQAMRRVLVDHARGRLRHKRGGKRHRVELRDDIVLQPGQDDDVLAVDEALQKLAQVSPRQARLVEMRFFAGLDMAEAAEALGVSKRTAEGDWTHVSAWLRRELAGDASS